MATAMLLVAYATTGDTLRIWKVGSPHRGDIPDAVVPFDLSHESDRHGYGISVEAFPARGFAATFHEAVTRNEAPDILVFDNFGVMDGITTELGTFEGIGEEPTLRHQLIRVTNTFDELLGPERGWTYLFSLSRNHEAARRLALRAPACPNGSSRSTPQGELDEIVSKVASAYVSRDASSLLTYSDADRLPPKPPDRDSVIAGSIQTCGVWGNDKLAFASVTASYDAKATIGHTRVLLVFRKTLGQWSLLAAARDPIATGEFVTNAALITEFLASDGRAGAFPVSATLLSPAPGEDPRPAHGQRFGTFTWRSSPSDDVVAEIAEFAYHDDTRLFAKFPPRAEWHSEISTGQLWTTRSEWSWRIWSISRGGDVAFSDVRTFQH